MRLRIEIDLSHFDTDGNPSLFAACLLEKMEPSIADERVRFRDAEAEDHYTLIDSHGVAIGKAEIVP